MLTPCLVNVPENRFALAATKARDFPKADDVRSAQMSSRDKDFRMRVLHFFKTYWPDTFGGVERTIHAIAKGCRAYGVEADVLALSPKPAPEPFVFDGHRVIQVKQDLDIASTGFSRAAFRAFRDLSRQADVVHFHFPWPFMDLVDLVTPHRKPVVVTYHSDIVKQKLLLRLYGPLMHHFLRGADRIVATSPNYLSSSPVLPLYRDKVEVIPLGLDEADYPAPDPQRIAYWQDRFPDGFFLFVGVLRYYKGIHILFEAARSTGLPVVIIGGGGLESELKARAERIEDAARPAHQENSAGAIRLANRGTHARVLVTLEDGPVETPDGALLFRTGQKFICQGDRIALLGLNGTGKTRLVRRLKSAIEGITQQVGIKPTPSLVLGYGDQALSELSDTRTPHDTIIHRFDVGDQRARRLLAGAGFSVEMQGRPVGQLSGGQKARLGMLVLRLMTPNFYLLDEPTNHLDIEGQEALERELIAQQASCLFVSHDRAFVRAVADRFWLIEKRRLIEVDGPEEFFAQAALSA